MKIQLEPVTFKIPVTEDWKPCENKEWRESPTGDVWVHYSGEQLYSWDAALRETKKAGKRLPTDEELDGMQPEDFAGLLVGYRNTDGAFNHRGSITYLWSSTESGSDAWRRYIFSSGTTVYRDTDSKAYGFSARTIKEVDNL